MLNVLKLYPARIRYDISKKEARIMPIFVSINFEKSTALGNVTKASQVFGKRSVMSLAYALFLFLITSPFELSIARRAGYTR